MSDQNVNGPQPTLPENEKKLITKNPSGEELEIVVFRPDREGIRKVLGDLEADIMEYVWEQRETSEQGVTVRTVYEAFRLRRVIAYTTVLSTMTRLSKKHLLQVYKEDTAHVYTPALSKESLIEKVVSHILENLLVSFSQTTHDQVKRLTTPESIQRLTTLKESIADLRKTPTSLHQEMGGEQRSTLHPNREEEVCDE